MQIMMGKIKMIESKCAFLEKENREKDRTIRVLQEKMTLMKQCISILILNRYKVIQPSKNSCQNLKSYISIYSI